MNKLTNEEVIKRIESIWGNEYDLSKVKYNSAREKIILICKKHGEFEVKLHDLLNGHGCKKCAFEKIKNKRTKTTEQFVEESKNVHKNRYNYSKVVYEGVNKKVCIICPEHGEFWQKAGDHLNGVGCPLCSGNKHKTTEDFIKKAKEVHGEKYDYSKVEYINNKTKVCIICPEHGEFWQTPNAHLSGQGCNLCSKPVHNTKSFIYEAKKIHSEKYDYSKVEYMNNNTPVCIICPEHGEFWQKPIIHIAMKCGCPLCNMSHLEASTMVELKNKNIEYIYQCRKNIFKWLGKQSLDFYLPDYNVAIECQGIQHFEPVEYFGGEKALNYRKKLDKKKRMLCEQNGLKIVYINNENEINDILNELQL